MSLTDELRSADGAVYADAILAERDAGDVVELTVRPNGLVPVLTALKRDVRQPFAMLFDLSAVDERVRRDGPPDHAFTLVHHLFSLERNAFVRVKTPLEGMEPTVPTATGVWPNADWYEREVFDLFGVRFDGHPNLRRILLPPTWKGHPLRKDHPARATEMEGYDLTDELQAEEEEALAFVPEEWGMVRERDDADFLFLNVGPQHPGTHGVLRIALQLDGEEILGAVADIGWHHRGAEKMGERQTWHTYIPYTDRIDYLAGVLNNLAYLLTVEQLAGIDVPPRAQVIRVMLCEMFRIASHLVWYGTFAQDVGAMTPVFVMFNDRENVFDVVQAICGARMHPNWFRIGGVADDLPEGWEDLVREFLKTFSRRLRDYDVIVMKNGIFKARTQGIGAYTRDEAIEWGVTGPGLRACGLEWDFRKRRPYSGYDGFEFDVPVAEGGDGYARAVVRVEELRQSVRIIQQCLDGMPAGPWRSDHPLATPPRKAATLQDIETLIHHFLKTTWGPVIPAGESFHVVESAKGANGYYLVSDGASQPYRVRIRTPSFPHLQMLPLITRGLSVADLFSVLGGIDYVLADVDR